MHYLPTVLREIPLTFIGGVFQVIMSWRLSSKIIKFQELLQVSLFIYKGKHFAALINYDNFVNDEL